MAKTIEDYKKEYAEAKAAGNAAGMKAANDGANAIRASQGQAAQVASEDIAKVAAKSSASSGTTKSGSYGGTSSIGSGGGSSNRSSRSTNLYGYNAADPNAADRNPNTGLSETTPSKTLDDEYGKWQELYSRMYEEAKAEGDYMGMQNANDNMNMVRNDYGLAAVRADNDIAAVAKQQGVEPIWVGGSAIVGPGMQQSSTAQQGSTTLPTGQGGVAVNDYSNYLEEMYAAQRKAAIAKLNSAYQSNLNAIDRAGAGLDTQYQNARNRAAGASELAARNFQEYAAAAGLNSGAGGQAELARNIALQNDLNELNTQEAATLADLELQRVQAETEFNAAIAQAEAQGDYELAAALYEEKIRQNEAALQQQMLVYQQQRDAVADNQWQLNFDRQVSSNLADYGNAFLKQGIMPSSEMLAAMGMSSEDAQRYLNTLSLTKSIEESNGNDTTGVDNGGISVRYNNGSLRPEQVKQLQAWLGVDQDGYFGPATSQAAGMTADEAWEKYQWDGIDRNSLWQLGYGMYTRAAVEEMVDRGELLARQDPTSGLIVFSVNPNYNPKTAGLTNYLNGLISPPSLN